MAAGNRPASALQVVEYLGHDLKNPLFCEEEELICRMPPCQHRATCIWLKSQENWCTLWEPFKCVVLPHTHRQSHIRTLQSDTVVPLCSHTSSFTAVTTVTHSSHTGKRNGSSSIYVLHLHTANIMLAAIMATIHVSYLSNHICKIQAFLNMYLVCKVQSTLWEQHKGWLSFTWYLHYYIQ